MVTHFFRAKLARAFVAAAFCLMVAPLVQAQESEGPYEYDVRFVERITFLNETGVVSIDYEEPWWFEMYQYALSLENAVYTQLDAANMECKRITTILEKDSGMRTGDRLHRVLQSMSVNGHIEPALLLSSLLKKFTLNNPVDAENEISQGRYKPLSGECDSTSAVRGGMVLQMFPPMDPDPVPLKSTFCGRVIASAQCLENLQTVAARNNAATASGIWGQVDLAEDTVFSVVSGSAE